SFSLRLEEKRSLVELYLKSRDSVYRCLLCSMHSSESVPCDIVLRKWAVVFHPSLKITTIIFPTSSSHLFPFLHFKIFNRLISFYSKYIHILFLFSTSLFYF
ncbi:hypothetical protein VIGAN_07026300, partial [Vigna angularis var. angularis]